MVRPNGLLRAVPVRLLACDGWRGSQCMAGHPVFAGMRRLCGAALLVVLTLTACGGGGGSDPVDASETTGAAGETETGADSSGSPSPSAGAATSETHGTGPGSSSDTVSATDSQTNETDGSTSGTGGTDESSTGDAPTSGPGVLPGETGLDSMCRRAIECGSTYYRDTQACIDAGIDYWGTCPEVTVAMDNFGACMSEIACEDYDPDAYNPSRTPCADLYGDLQEAGPC